MTAGYAKNVYYSLETGTVKSVDANSWDIAIRSSGRSVGIFANHAVNNVMVHPLTGLSAAAKFGQDLRTDTAGIVGAALYNSIETWESGAFNADADPTDLFDFGWGKYDQATHIISGDKIYLVTVGSTAAYQVWIKEDVATLTNAHWTIKIANLDGTNVRTKEFDVNPTYTGKLFAYYNFATDQLIDRDAASNSWDILFTKYTGPVSMGGAPVMYPLTGILSNENRGVVEVAGAAAPTATWSATMEASLDSSINVIGNDWKKSNFANGVYPVKDSLTYFMKVPSGDVWQLELTYASLGNTGDPSILPGRIGLRKRKVYTKPAPTGVEEINAYVNNMLIAPNPAIGGAANLLVDAKQELKNAQLVITDLSGRVVMNAAQNIKAGFHQLRLDVSRFPAGVYVVQLSGAGFSTKQKMVIQ